MRLALFAILNVAIAGFFGIYAFAQGKSLGEIAFTVLLVLVVIQLAYVVWLVAVSLLKPEEEAPETGAAAEPLVPRSSRRLSSAQGATGKQVR